MRRSFPVVRARSAIGVAVPDRRRSLAALALWTANAAGGATIVAALVLVSTHGVWPVLVPFLALASVAELMKVQILESNRERLSFTLTIVVIMAAVTVVPWGAPLTALAAGAIHTARTYKPGQAGKQLFKLTNTPLAAGLAAAIYLSLTAGARHDGIAIDDLLIGLAAVVAFYLGNTGLVALMISLHSGQPLASVLRDSSWSTPIMLLLGLTGAFLGNVYWESGPITVCMFLVPVLVMHVTLAFYSRKSRQAIETLQTANEEVERARQEKEQTLRQMIATIGAIIDARDNAVAGHSERVAAYAVALGRELGLRSDELDHVRTAGLLHDLGKIAVPEAILHKPARLTDEEYTIVKAHAATGERILAEVQPLAEVARMVGDHHERFDGSGYPNGERGTAITTGGRIVAVADTLDSILSDRPYSKGKPLSWALDELDRCAGTHFDPVVVAALHRVVATLGPDFFSRMTYTNTTLAPDAVSPQEALEAALAAIVAA